MGRCGLALGGDWRIHDRVVAADRYEASPFRRRAWMIGKRAPNRPTLWSDAVAERSEPVSFQAHPRPSVRRPRETGREWRPSSPRRPGLRNSARGRGLRGRSAPSLRRITRSGIVQCLVDLESPTRRDHEGRWSYAQRESMPARSADRANDRMTSSESHSGHSGLPGSSRRKVLHASWHRNDVRTSFILLMAPLVEGPPRRVVAQGNTRSGVVHFAGASWANARFQRVSVDRKHAEFARVAEAE